MKENIEEDLKYIHNALNEMKIKDEDKFMSTVARLFREYTIERQENEEWQRAYQKEKDEQFELLRENQELKYKYDKALSDVIARVDLDNTYISAQKIKDKIEELEKLNIKDNESVKKLEETRRNTDSDFYKKSYQISIHKLNAQIETRKHIISELQELLEEKGE